MSTLKPVVVYLDYDSDVDNPCDEGQWKIHSFNYRHCNFVHPDKLGIGASFDPENEDHVSLREKLNNRLAFPLGYYEHGNCSWFISGQGGPGTNCRWDGVQFAGVAEAVDVEGLDSDQLVESCEGFLETYTDWCNGACYRFSVQEICESCSHTVDDVIDSCGGFIGDISYMLDEIKSSLGGRQVLRVEGPCKDFIERGDLPMVATAKV